MKISKANKGKHSGHVPWNKGKTGIHSPETIEKMTKHLKGNTFKKGKKCSEESKLKMRIAHLGKQPKTIATRPVEQYDMNGVFIAKYSSVSEAVKQSGCSRSRITGVCRGNRPHTKNFIWKYATDSIVITNNPNVK